MQTSWCPPQTSACRFVELLLVRQEQLFQLIARSSSSDIVYAQKWCSFTVAGYGNSTVCHAAYPAMPLLLQ